MASPLGIPLLPQTPEELDQWYGDAPLGVRANMIQSVDGAEAFQGRTRQISDESDQALLNYLRSHADAVLVGGATVQAEGYGSVRLDDAIRQRRVAAGHAAVPPVVIVTARALLSPDLKVFQEPETRPIVMTTAAAQAAAEKLGDRADVVILEGTAIAAAAILDALRARGLGRVLCEGGPFLLSQLIEADLVEEMCLTVSPYLAGAQPTTPKPASARELPTRLRLRHVLTRNDLLYLKYARA